jgi:hypothetical protein
LARGKLWNRGRLYTINFVESRRLGKKEAMIFPSQLHKIASIAKEAESQEAIEPSGALYVSDDDLGHELLPRVDVSGHGWVMQTKIILPCVTRQRRRPGKSGFHR